MGSKLRGQVILNTRPAHQQSELTALLEREGARVLSFPVIEILPAPARENPPDITQYDILLFVSRNAVDGAFDRFDAAQLAAVELLGVIGSATHAALSERIENVRATLIASEPYNSEALLAAASLQQVAGKRILILRGQDGVICWATNSLVVERRSTISRYTDGHCLQPAPPISNGWLSPGCRHW